MKWLWRYGQPEAGYWKDIILAKYGAQNHWSANRNREPHGESTLKIAFPRLYRVASNRDASIAQYREGNVWSPVFRRNLQDWEINDLLQLLGALENYILAEAPDRIIWGNSKKGEYTVKQCYEIGCSENGLLENWPWKHVWRTRQPLKVSCFTWTALKGACLTQDNLRRRGIILINRCHLCYQTNETVNHLFLHCPVTAAVWHFFFSLFGLSWVMPSSIKDAFESWILWRVDKSIKRIWRMIPAAIFCVDNFLDFVGSFYSYLAEFLRQHRFRLFAQAKMNADNREAGGSMTLESCVKGFGVIFKKLDVAVNPWWI
ncbi:uncharacterized protein LOC132042988 [Lycium ferocissimum]|uniref:uncharacterized protein LOC132042988 n=1 Tax=Lycium ferocissimum TaxID=112874 RepID=UPI002816384F|nr:uncharacterized protein LOC132042988 [Lycium ferocissimum]